MLVVVVAALSLLRQLPYSGAAFTVCSSVAYPRRLGIFNCRHGPLHVADAGAASNDVRRDDTTQPTNNNNGLGLLRGVDVTADNFYATKIDTSREGLAWLDQPGLMWEAAIKDAAAKKIPVEEYIQQVESNFTTFGVSGFIYDRLKLLRELNMVFTAKGAFSLLLGGKSVGKSTILRNLCKVANNNSSSPLLALYVNGRLYPRRLNDGLANEATRLAAQKINFTPDTTDWVELLQRLLPLGRAKITEKLFPKKAANEPKSVLQEIVDVVVDSLPSLMSGAKTSQSLLEKFIKLAQSENKFPVLVIDEANEVLAFQNNGNPDNQTRDLLVNLVSYTKEYHAMNLVLTSSEHAYPYKLQGEGFNLRNIDNLIFAGEIPPKEMWKLLVSATYEEGDNKGRTIIGMGPHLAELCLAAYGGHFWTVGHAIQGLASKQGEAEVSVYLPNLSPEIIACLNTNTKARPLLEAMAKYGFAPVEAPDNPAAKLISEKNIGGVVTKNGVCIDISTTQWQGTEDEFALVPSSQCVRLRIARVLRTRNNHLLSPARFVSPVLKQIRKALGLGKP